MSTRIGSSDGSQVLLEGGGRKVVGVGGRARRRPDAARSRPSAAVLKSQCGGGHVADRCAVSAHRTQDRNQKQGVRALHGVRPPASRAIARSFLAGCSTTPWQIEGLSLPY